jgi:hypothetical protein
VAEVGRALARQEQEKSPEIVNVELNLEEPPLFGGRVSVGANGYRKYIQEYRKSDGSVGQRMWRWRPPEEYGADRLEKSVGYACTTRGGDDDASVREPAHRR